LVVSCSTGKHAYEGDKRDVSELATIEVVATENSKALLGNHKETPNVTHVDDYEVGSYIGGFPKKLFVIPGEHVLKTEYQSSQATKGAATTLGVVLGGALGAAVGASIDRARNAELIENTKKETSINVQAGQGYYLKAQSEDGKGQNLKVWLEGPTTL